MTLKEKVHQSIDALDDDALALVYDHIQILVRTTRVQGIHTEVPSLDEVLALTAMDPGDWGEQVISDRDERL